MVAPLNHSSLPRLNDVPASLQSGTYAMKWPEDNLRSASPDIVNLSVDPKGFYLICHKKIARTIECFDLALIHDTRTGSAASVPPHANSCPAMHLGNLGETLRSKWLTIYYGSSFVPSQDFRAVHFAFKSSQLAEEWAKRLFAYGHNQWLKNFSSLECLEKLHSRIVHGLIDLNRQAIPVQKLIDFLCGNSGHQVKKDTIHRALKASHLPRTIDSVIRPEQLTFDVFFGFYMHLTNRQEIDALFIAAGARHEQHLSREKMRDFMKKQDDAIGDLFDEDFYEQKATHLLAEHAQHTGNPPDEGIDRKAFLRYLLSADNLIVDPLKFGLCMNMDKPLSHYFIASSHNTYLTGGQWSGYADDEMYRQVLLTGCRCIEIDVVDSENNEPVVKHIHTPVRAIPFQQVITAIRDCAFKTSTFPVTLSIENHCSAPAQAIMAKTLVDILDTLLLTEPLASHPCEENYPLPSPKNLEGKILIKNKKLQPPATTRGNNQKTRKIITPSSSDPSTDISTASSPCVSSFGGSAAHLNTASNHPRYAILYDDSSSDEHVLQHRIDILERASHTTDILLESKATRAMSDLVIYCVPVRFVDFARAQKAKRSYEMSSFSEDHALSLTRDLTRDFQAYNQRQCSRIYPHGLRVSSSNFNPYPFWQAGCQMVALNYQTLDVYMQLNLGMFSFNNACGYIEKPAVLCEPHSSFDPQAVRSIGSVGSCEIHLKVLSGQFLCQPRKPSLVNIQLHGAYDDQARRREYNLSAKLWNGFQAVYDDSPLTSHECPCHFTNIFPAEMAALRFEVCASNGTQIGQCFLPVSHLRSGYRYVVLRDKMNVPVQAASLFIFVQKTTYATGKNQASVQPITISGQHLNGSSEDLSVSVVRRAHVSTMHGSTGNLGRRDMSVPVSNANWYEVHVLGGSEFRDHTKLCRVTTLYDIKPEEIRQRDESLGKALRRISVEYKEKIGKEERNFEVYLATRHDDRLRSKSVKGTTSKKESEAPEQRLLNLYTEKLRQQERTEQKHLNNYWNELSASIKKDYPRQLNQLATIFKEEKSRAQDDAQFATIHEANLARRPGTSWKRFLPLVDKGAKASSDNGASTILKLETMYMKAKDTLQTNYQTSLEQVAERQRSEGEACTEKYRQRLEESSTRVRRRILHDEYDVPSPDPPLPRRTAATNSLPPSGKRSFPVPPSSELQCRRQTMDY